MSETDEHVPLSRDVTVTTTVLESTQKKEAEPAIVDGRNDTRDASSETLTSALVARNRQLDRRVKATLAERKAKAAERQLPEFSSYLLPHLEKELYALLRSKGYEGGKVTLSVPPSTIQHGQGPDVACNLASVAKSLQLNAVDFAKEVAALFAQDLWVASISTAGPFLNIHLNHQVFASDVLTQIQDTGEHYGSYNEGNGAVVLVDYSAPNVAKNMTVAHLRSTIIGHSLSKLHAAAGYTPLRVNHLGDWGTQFGKIIYQYRKELAQDGDAFLARLHENPAAVLLEIYRKFGDEGENDPLASDEARQIFLQLERGDPELTTLWEKFLAWSMTDFSGVYDRLGIDFDAIQGESFYEDRMTGVVEEALEKGVLKRNKEGAVVFPGQSIHDPTNGKMNHSIMKDKDGEFRDEVILKPSGGTVYLTRDLAAIRYRTQELGADRIIYVIGKEQQKHCLMLFAMAEQLGYIEHGQAEHISFGHLNVDGRKMKSRSGTIALLNDVLDASIQAADSVMRAKNRDDAHRPVALPETEMETVAKQVGMSAVIFNDLRQDRQRDIEFTPDVAQHVESGQCPYLQYAYCRLKAISEKAGESGSVDQIPAELSSLERGMIVHLAAFPKVIQEAVNKNTPHKIATYMTELSQMTNNFYTSHPVTKAEGSVRAFRLALVEGCQRVLLNAAHLLHIELPDRM